MNEQRIRQIEAYARQMMTGPFVVESFRIAHGMQHVERVYHRALWQDGRCVKPCANLCCNLPKKSPAIFRSSAIYRGADRA